MTAVITTILGFLPVFAMTGAEGKLFKPLAFTKTFALAGSILLALTVLPPLAAMLFRHRNEVSKPWKILRVQAQPAWKHILRIVRYAAIALVVILLAANWRPIESSVFLSLLLVVLIGGAWLVFFHFVLKFFRPVLGWCLGT